MTMPESTRPDLFVSYASADQAWVEGFLRDALDRAGARYLHEAAFALGVPILHEFERAVRECTRTLLVLSPEYLAGGLNAFLSILAETFGAESATWPVIPLILRPCQLPTRLSMLTRLDATDPARWDTAIARLCEEITKPVPGPAVAPECPYPGMRHYTTAEASRFFGRDDEIRALADKVAHQRLTFVIGPSGSGKSSLVFAGLLPLLERDEPGRWHVLSLRPGADPLGALAEALGATSERPATDWSEPDWSAAVTRALASAAPAERLLVVVDQAEELFARDVPRDAQDALVRAVQAIRGNPACRTALTLRSDFFGDLQNSDFWPVDASQRVEIGPLRGEGLRSAIVAPAEAVGVRVDPALTDRLLADAAGATGVLPMLQEAMRRLWKDLRRHYVPMDAYRHLAVDDQNGLITAIAAHADGVMQDTLTTEAARTTARRIFLRLVQFGEGRPDTRRQQPASALRSEGEDAAAFDTTLRALVDNGILTSSGRPSTGEAMIDMAHEALIAGWPTLRGWIDEWRHAELTRRRLEEKALEWQRLRRVDETAGLLDAVELREAEAWLASEHAAAVGPPDGLAALVTASRGAIERAAAERRKRRERVVAAAVAVMGGLAILAAAAWWQRGVAIEQGRVSLVRGLWGQSLGLMERRLDTAILLATQSSFLSESWGLKEDRQSQSALLSVQQQNPWLSTMFRGHSKDVKGIAFSPDGNVLASGSWDNTIILWDIANRTPIGPPLTGHGGEVNSVAFSPDGNTLASGSSDSTIILWNVTNRSPIGPPLTGHGSAVNGVAFSPDGNTLASGSSDSTIILWNVTNRSPIDPPLIGHGGAVNGVAFSPDGNTLASGSSDSTIILWNVTNRSPIGPLLRGHSGTVRSQVNGVTFSPDGKTLASGSSDQTIILWDVASRTPIGQPLTGHDKYVTIVVYSPDGKTLASGSSDKSIIIWNVAGGSPIGQPLAGHDGRVRSVAFSPDGNTLTSGSSDSTIILWDIANRTPIGQSLPGHSALVNSVVFSPDGKTFASGSDDGTVIHWEVASRAPIGQPLTGHDGSVRSIVFSPDGKTLASGSDDKTIILWDMVSHAPIGPPLTGHSGAVNSVAFSPDGTTLASGSSDATIILWDIANRTPIGGSLKGHNHRLNKVVFNPDGKTIASGSWDNTIILWDTASHSPIDQPIKGHRNGVMSLTFSPDGKTLASGSGDTTIILWDVASRAPLGQPLTGHSGAVTSVAFSPDGKIIASGSDDKTIILWDIDPASLRARACRIVNRNLTLDEWRQYIGDTIPYECTCPDFPAGEGASPNAPRCKVAPDATPANQASSP